MSVVAEPANKPAGHLSLVWPSRTTTITWLVLLFGAILRLARWFHWRALWLDEIYLANSIVHRSLHDLLLKPLEDWQAAPPGFLALEHLAMQIFGSGERSLRLVSLLFGLASLPLMLAVSRRLLKPLGALVAVTMFVFLGPLIYYSNELKPYSCDVVASLAITLTVLRWLEDKTFRRAAAAAIVGGVAVFFSYPAVFVVAGIGALVLWGMATNPGNLWFVRSDPLCPSPGTPGEGKGRGRGKLAFLPICVIWGIAFSLQYLFFIRPLTHGEAHPHLVQYWIAQDAFMPISPGAAIKWIFWSLHSIAQAPGAMWLDYPDAALVGLAIGTVIAVQRRNLLLILLAPLPVVLLASATKQYPFGDRLALFFVPQYLLLIALAVESLWTNLPGKTAAITIAGLIVLPSASRAVGYIISPPGREESLPAYRWVSAHCRRGDEVYLTHFGERSFEYYRSESAWPPDVAIHIQPEIIKPSQIFDDIKPFAGHRRVWVITIHAEGGPFDVQQFTLAAFNDIGVAVQRHLETGAMVYLYDCSPTQAGSSGARQQ